LTLSSKLRTYSNDLVSSVHLARGEAIKRNSTMTLCASTDGATCSGGGSWQPGWIMLDSSNALIASTPRLASDFSLTATELGTATATHTLTFSGSGLVTPASGFVLCRKTPIPGNQERSILVTPSGQVTVNTTTLGTCS
jgi:type IV fimbrial biogenesis protein FimT